MNRTKSRSITGRRANALVLALIAVAVLVQLSAVYMMRTLADVRYVENRWQNAELFYAAEGAMEASRAEFRQLMGDLQIDAQTTRHPAAGTLDYTFQPTPSMPAAATAASFIEEVAAGQQAIVDGDGVPVWVKNYLVTTTVQHPADAARQIVLHQIVSRRLVHAFHYGVFYNDDLEILPGPAMTFRGRIHANGNLYLGANTSLTLNSEHIRATGDVFRSRKNDGTTYNGTTIHILKAGTASTLDMAGLDSNHPQWTTVSQTRWDGSIQNGVHGVSEVSSPSVGSIQPGGVFETTASVKVVNGQLEKDGFTMVEGVDVPPGTVTTSSTLYNHREGRFITTTDIDMRKLSGYDDGDPDGSPSYPNRLPPDGLMYVSQDDPGDGTQPAVRLVNGSQINNPSGLTVVTPNPMYIQGNYNSTDKKPCSVIADSVNILSNNWQDSNSTKVLNQRSATNTTVNSAFIAGVDTTQWGSYNGGLENYPRFHENWSGRTLFYSGAFISLWNSSIATGPWANSSYSPPNRAWTYEDSFLTTLPPHTPSMVETVTGAWWRG